MVRRQREGRLTEERSSILLNNGDVVRSQRLLTVQSFPDLGLRLRLAIKLALRV
jgi:hypothetical protein